MYGYITTLNECIHIRIDSYEYDTRKNALYAKDYFAEMFFAWRDEILGLSKSRHERRKPGEGVLLQGRPMHLKPFWLIWTHGGDIDRITDPQKLGCVKRTV